MELPIQNKNLLKFFPKSLLKLINNGSGNLDILPGSYSQKEINVLYADIRNFTGISEKINSNDIFLLMNDFAKQIIPAVTENNGIIDKFIGDAFLAIFPSSPDDAVKSAIRIMDRIDSFNESIKDKDYYPINMGIGIHRGNCTLGVVGNDEINQIAILGDAVNLSARIESATKTYKTPILISDSVHRNIKNTENFYFREIDTVRVKGKDHPVILYEICNCNRRNILEKKQQLSEIYNQALNLYKSGDFSASKILFEKCLAAYPDDPISQIYIKRCGTFLRMPPSDDWCGITGIL